MPHDPKQPEAGRPPAAASADWSRLVHRIKGEDPGAMEELYRLFSRGVRFYLCRRLGSQELEDKVHDTFLIVVQAILRGELREPERLMGFVRTVVQRQVAACIERNVQQRRDLQDLDEEGGVSDYGETPEEIVISRQRVEIMEAVLRELNHRDREVLTRFYLLEQPQGRICAEMHLTETQFRLLKSRAKARFGQKGRRRLTRRLLDRVFLRKAHPSGH